MFDFTSWAFGEYFPLEVKTPWFDVETEWMLYCDEVDYEDYDWDGEY